MTLTELRYIVAVARERHFGRAAQSCFVSQPTLSMGVKRLEEQLGVSLFERNKQDIAPTPIGHQVIAQAQRVLEEAETINRIAEFGKDPLSGPLRIGAIYTIGPYLLPHMIPRLNETAPNMPLVIEEDFTANLRSKLKQGKLDVIIISYPFEEPGVSTWALYDEPFIAVLPKNHAWVARPQLSSDELAELDLLLLGAGHCFRDQVLQACPDCNRSADSESSMQKTLEGSSLETIRHMVASGMGCTVLPCTAKVNQYAGDLLAYRPFASPAPKRRVALAWRNSFHRIQAIEHIHDTILQCIPDCVSAVDEPMKRETSSKGK